ncbi:MAG: hypothetical protein K1X88_17970 [Nannocystaceae bacterium]|nr:hypothetical protein [Nannocystaceae bacterium]
MTIRVLACLSSLLLPVVAHAAEIPADPTNYQTLLPTLQPGDTLVLAPGTYPRLTIDGLHGTADAWITITGPESGDAAVVVGDSCCNTVQLYDASFVAVRNLTIDAMGQPVDAVNAKDTPSHDILIENNIMQGFPAGEQQIVGVNTKTTVWNWTVRGNRIIEPGTGLYLGGSEGDTPFIAGTIEGNVVVNPVGYCMQVKHQNDYAALPDMPAGPNATIIRHNIFIKDDRESPDGDRPNLLVGGFPDNGPGSEDRYHIYGNLLLYNPREALLQATGRVSIHDNLFVGSNAGFAALVVTPHQGKSVRSAYVYNNTVYGDGTAIAFSEAASEDDAVVGNLLLAATGLSGPIADARDNLEAPLADAGQYVAMPAVMLGAMDFYPLPGAVEGSALDLSKMAGEPEFDRDYNGQAKGGLTFRGAYAGAGDDPCGPLDDVVDDCAATGGDTGGSESGDGGSDSAADSGGGSVGGSDGPGDGTAASSAGGSGDTGGSSGGSAQDEGNGGCGCNGARTREPAWWWLALGVGLRRSRSRERTRAHRRVGVVAIRQ